MLFLEVLDCITDKNEYMAVHITAFAFCEIVARCLAAGVVWELKRKYPSIRSVLVLPYLDREYDMSG